MAGDLDQVTCKGPFPPKPFCDSMTLHSPSEITAPRENPSRTRRSPQQQKGSICPRVFCRKQEQMGKHEATDACEEHHKQRAAAARLLLSCRRQSRGQRRGGTGTTKPASVPGNEAVPGNTRHRDGMLCAAKSPESPVCHQPAPSTGGPTTSCRGHPIYPVPPPSLGDAAEDFAGATFGQTLQSKWLACKPCEILKTTI